MKKEANFLKALTESKAYRVLQELEDFEDVHSIISNRFTSLHSKCKQIVDSNLEYGLKLDLLQNLYFIYNTKTSQLHNKSVKIQSYFKNCCLIIVKSYCKEVGYQRRLNTLVNKYTTKNKRSISLINLDPKPFKDEPFILGYFIKKPVIGKPFEMIITRNNQSTIYATSKVVFVQNNCFETENGSLYQIGSTLGDFMERIKELNKKN